MRAIPMETPKVLERAGVDGNEEKAVRKMKSHNSNRLLIM